MKKFNLFFTALIFGASLSFTSCGSDDDSVKYGNVSIDILNLETLPESGEYEAWIVVNGENVSLGKFTSLNFPREFKVELSKINEASAFKLSIEAGNDSSPAISNAVIVSGNFSGNAATVNMSNAIGNFDSISGNFVLETPTDNEGGVDNGNDQAGIYFYDPATNTAGLNLPSLPSGWEYNGWVIYNNTYLPTGSFRNPSGKDDFAPYSSQLNAAPNFPGEDFLNSAVAPAGVTFPADLRNKGVFISIQPKVLNTTEPFFIQPLKGNSGEELSPTLINLNIINTASFPLGTVIKG